MTPEEYCQEKSAQSGSSFYASFRFLSPEKRLAMTALYAFCREVDDVVDETENVDDAKEQLDEWRAEVEALYQHAPQHPVGKALLPHLAVFPIQKSHLLAIIDGMAMDLGKVRYQTYEALQGYCWHVAGVVGFLSASIFGITQDKTWEYAEKLGLAFQLTNILRDVGEDAQMGRIYLPADELAQFGVTEDDLLNLRHNPNFEALMQFQVKRAQAVYDEALALLPNEDRKSQRPGLIMSGIYRALLGEIEKHNYRVLNQRISLSTLRKISLAWRAYIRG